MTDSSKPVVAQRAPFMMDLAPGDYWWCACGLSKKQPFCDGSHKVGSLSPTKLTVTAKTGTLWLCGCKQAKTKPFCDGTHNKLKD